MAEQLPYLIRLADRDGDFFIRFTDSEIFRWIFSTPDFDGKSSVREQIPGTDRTVTVTAGSYSNDRMLELTPELEGFEDLSPIEAYELMALLLKEAPDHLIEGLVY